MEDLKKPGPIHVSLLKERMRQLIEVALKELDQLCKDPQNDESPKFEEQERMAYETAMRVVAAEISKLQHAKAITTAGEPRQLAELFVDWYYEDLEAQKKWPLDRGCE